MSKSLCIAVITLLSGVAASGHAYFPTGDIFEIRPSRVRVATSGELDGTTALWRSFLLNEPLPNTLPQESLSLTDVDSLAVVLPVRNWANSDMSSYEVGSLEIEDFDITLDYYIFDNPNSGSLDSFSPPAEQVSLLGALPSGDYSFNIRRWYLNAEDRSGFDESEVEQWSAPSGDGLYVVPSRYVTDDEFTFTVLSTSVPEPTTGTMLFLGASFLCSRRTGRRHCIDRRT